MCSHVPQCEARNCVYSWAPFSEHIVHCQIADAFPGIRLLHNAQTNKQFLPQEGGGTDIEEGKEGEGYQKRLTDSDNRTETAK